MAFATIPPASTSPIDLVIVRLRNPTKAVVAISARSGAIKARGRGVSSDLVKQCCMPSPGMGEGVRKDLGQRYCPCIVSSAGTAWAGLVWTELGSVGK